MVTEERDLRTGLSYWQRQAATPLQTTPLLADVATDVLVVGAGITGAIVAEAVSRTHRVVVVDRRGPAMGSTAASTALVEHEIDTPLIRLAGEIGERKAARAWLRSRAAVRNLAATTRALAISCDMRSASSVYLCGNLLDPAAMEDEAAARREIGLDAILLSPAQLSDAFDIVRDAALLTAGNLTVDPRRMAVGFLAAAMSRGAVVHAPVDVVGLDTSSGIVRAVTGDGPVVTARLVVLATGYELPPFVPRGAHRIVSTYAIATRSQPGRLWPGEALVWEASDPYLYMRTTPDGSVLCGGEDEDFADEAARDALIPEKAATIAEKLHGLFPRLDTTPAFSWAGAFGTTETGLPLIAEVPGLPGGWLAVGFGGNGMTYAEIAAEIVVAALAGKMDPDADLYGIV